MHGTVNINFANSVTHILLGEEIIRIDFNTQYKN
jgi:hypothetical protein